ncbi:ATP-grasp domain-containing protein [Hymenobacter mellowenesis]
MWGVTRSGETLIVECNDFWALGTYGMDPVRYSQLLATRWKEMVG